MERIWQGGVVIKFLKNYIINMSLFKRSMSLKAVVSNDQHLQKEHIGPKIDQTSPDETYVLSTTYWSYPISVLWFSMEWRIHNKHHCDHFEQESQFFEEVNP